MIYQKVSGHQQRRCRDKSERGATDIINAAQVSVCNTRSAFVVVASTKLAIQLWSPSTTSAIRFKRTGSLENIHFRIKPVCRCWIGCRARYTKKSRCFGDAPGCTCTSTQSDLSENVQLLRRIFYIVKDIDSVSAIDS
jgi:hypothetical protein